MSFEYIEILYNRKRPHSSLGYRSLIRFWMTGLWMTGLLLNRKRKWYAFGENFDEINLSRVKAAAIIACIEEFIESENDKYFAKVGENGIKLSGEQRQRLGIARALYKDFNVLVLDEATRSLDMHTELEVMRRMHKLNPNITLIIIAHRLATLKDCDYILEVFNGGISEANS